MFYVLNVNGLPWVAFVVYTATPQNPWEWWSLCAGCDKKRQMLQQSVCCWDTFNLEQVTDSGRLCVQVGTNWLDIRRCWSEDQWRILSWHASDSTATVCNAWDLSRVSLPSNNATLFTEHTRQSTFWNDVHITAFILLYLWQPNSTDLNLLYRQIWGEMHQRVYQVHDVDELKQRLISVWRGFEQIVINAVDEWRKRLCVCSHRRSQDFVWGCTFLAKKLTTFFSRRPHRPSKYTSKYKSLSKYCPKNWLLLWLGGALRVLGGCT